MKIVSYVLCFIGAFLNLFVLVKCYEKTLSEKYELNLKSILTILISAIFDFIINMFVVSKFKIVFMLLLVYLMLFLIFKEKYYVVLFKTLYLYIAIFIFDFLISLFLLILSSGNKVNMYALDILKAFSTFFVTLFLYLLFKIRKFLSFTKNLFKLIESKSSSVIIIVIVIIFSTFVLATYVHAFNFLFESFWMTFFLLLAFSFLSFVLVKEFIKNKTALAEQKALLDIMNEYESMLEVNRENRHEMLNNLVVLKSFKNKASIEYEDLLSEILNDYQNKKNGAYTKLYTLPTGVKGIVYYKVANIIDKNINFNTEISKEVYTYFDKLDAKLYYKVCKIIGILLDNAIEATIHTNEKLIFIEMFKLGNELFVLIQNSCEDKVDLENINKKGFSTKGKNHGYGLYIVNKLVASSEQLSLSQYMFDNDFVTELKITL